MSQSLDISWHVLQQIVRQWAGASAELAEVSPLFGGVINTTLGLSLADGKRAVLKITPHRIDKSYKDEAHQLSLLRAAHVPVPEVYLCETGTLEEPFSYLLMQFVEGMDLAAAHSACAAGQFDQLQVELAALVVRLHECTSPRYSRCTAEPSPEYDDWPSCYRNIFEPIRAEVEKSGVLPVKARKIVGKVHDRLDRLLAHNDRPRLVHWDLWATNILARRQEDGTWKIAAILDPNCKFAHAEAEIAYLELFQTATTAFMKAYQQTHKLSAEYHRIRKPVYQLYSLLNHLCLFGNEYLKPACAAIDRVAPLV